MRGKIIRDYLGMWRWEKLKKAWENGEWWWDFYMVFLLPLIFVNSWEWQFTLRYILCALPLIWERLESVILPMGLSKIQYLCPMEEGERKAYIIGIYWIKVLVPFAVFSMGQAVCIGLKWAYPVGAAASIIVFLLISMILHMNPMFPKEVRERQFAGFRMWHMAAAVSGALILLLGYTFADAEWTGSVYVPVAVYGVLVIIQALLTGKVMTYFGPIVEAALHYENTCGERPKRWGGIGQGW